MSSSIKKVIVIGASGGVGPAILSNLLASNFDVSILTRESSKSTFPSNITVHCTGYSTASLTKAFQGQDAVVSCIETLSTSLQSTIVSAAVTCGVQRFIPSEYGIDTSTSSAEDFVPLTKPKRDTIKALKAVEEQGISWTAVCVGVFFDWIFNKPLLMGWNVEERKALLFDNGNYEYEATNLDQIGKAVAAVLRPENLEATKNQYVYVNSFVTSQNRVLEALERFTGDKFEVEHAKAEDLAKVGWEGLALKGRWQGNEAITSAIYGNGGLNNFSKTRGLWNDRLGLPKDDMEESLKRVVKELYGTKAQ